MSASPDIRIIPPDLALVQPQRLAAIVALLAQRCQDEPKGETRLPAERCMCSWYRLILPEDIRATVLSTC